MVPHSIIKNTLILDSYYEYFVEEKAGIPPCTLRGFTDSERIDLEQKCKYVTIVDKATGERFTREISHIKHAPMYNFSDGRQPIVISWKHPDPADEIIQKAISTYGEPAQVLKCIEELAELAIELSGTIAAKNKYFNKGMIDLVHYLTNAVNLCKHDVPSTTSEIRFLPPNEERYGDIVSELADVLIMTSQIKEIFNITDEQLQKEKEFKLKRLEERIQNDNKTM